MESNLREGGGGRGGVFGRVDARRACVRACFLQGREHILQLIHAYAAQNWSCIVTERAESTVYARPHFHGHQSHRQHIFH
jgi:hypothetical protein